jgi:DNA ligase-1
MLFRPMLAPGEDPLSYPDYFDKLKYPLLCSPKYDGIRCIVRNKLTMSRSMKLLPSKQVQTTFGKEEYNYFDGELIEGSENDPGVYNRTQSHVMSENKPGNLTFFVFDYTHPDYINRPFFERLGEIRIDNSDMDVRLVEHIEVNNYDELIYYENKCLDNGFEGIMMRSPVGHYKMGRGTFKESLIYKLKRFKDDECIIVDMLPMMENHNTLEVDELGYAKRSSHKDNLVASEMVGKFIVWYKGQELEVAPGSFDHKERTSIYFNKNAFIGKYLKFRYFEHGVKDKPRFPRALGFRTTIDL